MHFPSSRSAGLYLTTCLALALSACGAEPSPSRGTDADQRKVAQAESLRVLHGVPFAPGSAYVSPAEETKLVTFARRQIQRGDEVTLVADDRGAGLQQVRLATVRGILERQGIAVGSASRTGEIAVGSDNVLVTATRWVARGPACPDWSKTQPYDPNNTTYSNFGCADAQNLGAMVANPRDLQMGQDPGPADGGRAAAAVERYRRDAVKQIVVVTTGSTAPSSGAGTSGPGAAVGVTGN